MTTINEIETASRNHRGALFQTALAISGRRNACSD